MVDFSHGREDYQFHPSILLSITYLADSVFPVVSPCTVDYRARGGRPEDCDPGVPEEILPCCVKFRNLGENLKRSIQLGHKIEAFQHPLTF